MLMKIGGLARALYIVLAIVAGFVALGGVDVALVLVALGLIAGTSAPRERLVLALAAVIALPLLGAALMHIPAVGAQLNAVMGNLQLGIAGAAVSMLAMFLYDLTMEGVMGLAGGASAATPAAATH